MWVYGYFTAVIIMTMACDWEGWGEKINDAKGCMLGPETIYNDFWA